MNCADPKHFEFYQFNVERLLKERQKITQRGRLSPSEDRRLDEIDDEMEHWQTMCDEVEQYEAEADMMTDDEDTLEYMAMLDRILF